MSEVLLIGVIDSANPESSFQESNLNYLQQMIRFPINSNFIPSLHEHIGIECLAAYLKDNHVDTEMYHMILHPDDSTQDIVRYILAENPCVLGFSLPYNVTVYQTLKIIVAARKAGYNGHITLGGSFVSSIYERFLLTFPFINSVIVGEGEEPLLALYQAVKLGRGFNGVAGMAFLTDSGVVYNKRELKQTSINRPIIQRTVLQYLKDHHVKNMSANVFLSRGCNNRCLFCMAPVRYELCKEKWRPRNIHSLITEIEYLIRCYQVSYLYFGDDNFCGYGKKGKEQIQNFIHGMIENNICIRFHAELRADSLLDEEDLIGLKKCGLDQVLIGLESGSQSCLDRWRKGVTVEQNQKMIDMLRKHNVKISPAIILMDPFMTFDEFQASVEFIFRNHFLEEESPWYLFNKMRVYPGSQLEQLLVSKGIIDNFSSRPYTIDQLNSDEAILKVYSQISFIHYDIQSKKMNELWNQLSRQVEDIIVLLNIDIPKKMDSFFTNEKTNTAVQELQAIRAWRKNLGKLLTRFLQYCIEWGKQNDEASFDGQELEKRLSAYRQEYDRFYLNMDFKTIFSEENYCAKEGRYAD